MAAIPPALIYLTIYNPTLKSESSFNADDEDAEEQAHILFYTARDRAVSRDRMLRQIGLAKALVNFSSSFSSGDGCNYVHSQSRRMIVLNPEPDFYLHACLEVSKTPRKSKAVSKDKKPNGKGKEQSSTCSDSWYYHEGSVNDMALRTHLEAGYEHFKLTHGTFAHILSTLGHQALELQLERFFTVWAWKWEVEEGFEFASLLGPPLHPHREALLPALDAAAFQLHDEDVHFVLHPPYLLPSARYDDAHIPPVLSQHLLELLPSAPRPPPMRRASSKTSTIRPHISRTWTGVTAESAATPAAELTRAQTEGIEPTTAHGNEAGPSRFLGMPSMSMNMSMDVMDVRKWNWGALTFGKGAGRKGSTPMAPAATSQPAPSSEDKLNIIPPKTELQDESAAAEPAVVSQVMVGPAPSDPSAEAYESSETIPVAPSDDSSLSSQDPTTLAEDGSSSSNTEALAEAMASNMSMDHTVFQSLLTEPDDDDSSETHTFMSLTVWLDELDERPIRRRRVSYLTKDDMTFVVIHKDVEELGDSGKASLVEVAIPLLDTLRNVVKATNETKTPEEIPTIVNILNAKDQHMILRGDGTFVESENFQSKSEHIFNARHLLADNPNILEVFSRGQHPQHWHIARRADIRGNDADGEAYLEVMRKEASLTDVDNVLASLNRK